MSPRAHIRRIGHDQIELALDALRDIAGDGMCSASVSPARSALARATSRAASLMSVPSPTAFGQFAQQREQQRAGAGADVENAQTRPFAIAIDGVERGLDHGLGFRPRHQHGRRDAQHEAPELLASADARDRLALEAPRGQGLRSAATSRVSSTRSESREQARAIDARARGRAARVRRPSRPRCRRDEMPAPSACVASATETPAFSAGITLTVWRLPPPEARPDAAVTSASMISSSASPSITCGSL